MRVKFMSISLWNFMCFEHIIYQFPEYGFHLVLGEVEGDMKDSNGAGKSALFEALTWVLFGKTMRDIQVAKVVRSGQLEAKGVLWFEIGEYKYQVIRTRTLSGRASTLTFASFRTDVAQGAPGEDLTGSSMEETDARIVGELGFSFELFKNSVFYGQGLPYRFVQSTDAQKKAIMEEILSLDWLQGSLLRTRSVRNIYRDILHKAGTEIDACVRIELHLDSQLRHYRELVEDVSTKRHAVELLLHSGESHTAYDIREQITRQNDLIIRVNVGIERLGVEIRRLREAVAQWNVTLSEAQTEVRSGVNQSVLVENQIDEAQTSIQRLSEPAAPCLMCKRPLPNRTRAIVISEIQASKVKLEDEHKVLCLEMEVNSTEITQMETQIGEYERQIVEQEVVLASFLHEKTTAERELAVWDVRLENTDASLQTQLDGLSEQLSQWEDLVRRDEGQLEEQLERKTMYGETRQGAISILNALDFYETGFSNRGIKPLVLGNVIPVLNGSARSYSDILTNGEFHVRFSVTGEPYERFVVEVVSEASQVDYSQFSGGEKRRVDVIVLMVLHDLIANMSGIETNIQVFDEVCENLDVVGVELLMEFLKTLADNRSIYVISHNNDFLSHFSSFLKVKKNVNGVSTVHPDFQV